MIDWQRIGEELNRAPWTTISPRVKEKRVFLTRLDWVPWINDLEADEKGQDLYEQLERQAASRGWYLDYNEDNCKDVFVCNLQLIFPMLQDDDADFKVMSEIEQ